MFIINVQEWTKDVLPSGTNQTSGDLMLIGIANRVHSTRQNNKQTYNDIMAPMIKSYTWNAQAVRLYVCTSVNLSGRKLCLSHNTPNRLNNIHIRSHIQLIYLNKCMLWSQNQTKLIISARHKIGHPWRLSLILSKVSQQNGTSKVMLHSDIPQCLSASNNYKKQSSNNYIGNLRR